MEYEVVVGLEVHAELCTKSKIYCGCKNAFGSEVNSNCCPICTGMPGTLPTLNEEVVSFAVKAGHALGCAINRVSKQDRKNYFYPDLPKAYQISQFDVPLCENGYVDVIVDDVGNTKRIGVTRIHIEEDAGKLLHDASFEGTLVDFNRCGVPLIEIVSEPDMRSAQEARDYLETLRSILVYIGVTDGKMQEGSLRCDVNVSVRPKGQKEFGTRCEMKNVNTFSGAFRAIEYEAKRQIDLLGQGGEIVQETRRWDDAKGQSFPLRSKEDAHDYRYFPEPDLGVIAVPQERVEALKELPELPVAKTLRYMRESGLPRYDASLLVELPEKAAFFEECIAIGKASAKAVGNWLLGDVSRILNEKHWGLADTRLTPAGLCDMIAMIEAGEISNTAGKTVLEEMVFHGKTAAGAVEEKGLRQISDTSALEGVVREVLAANAAVVEQYKGGKTNVLGFLVGQSMKATKGQGNPAMLRDMLLGLIEGQ